MTREQGFTLIDVTMASLVTGLLMAIAIPTVETARQRYMLTAAAREVAADLRSARLTALTTNRTFQVRFNCPSPRDYRVIEVVGVPAIDNDPNRCSLAAYPYPPPNPGVAPSQDGPLRTLPGQLVFGQLQNIQIDRAGRVTPVGVGALPAVIGVASPHDTRNVSITVAGRVQSP